MNKQVVLFILFTFIIALTGKVSAQSDGNFLNGGNYILPEGLGLSNQMKYSYDQNIKQEIFEDWLNLDYSKGIFSTGIRFETFQPNDPNPSISRGKTRFAGIDYKYVKLDIGDVEEGIDFTVGNFYELFGRGLVLKSYEDRNIRVDNNLLGVKLTGKFEGFVLNALTGMPENSNAERKDILHAFDLEYRGLKKLKVGFTFASNQPDVDGAARTRLMSLRLEPSIWNFDFYGEFGVKQNDDDKQTYFSKSKSAIVGKAIYGGTNFYLGSLALSGEYKYYDNFNFQSGDGTVQYNTPPSLRKEYTYVLLNRHPSPLNAADEQGFQVETDYNINDDNSINASYGLTKTLPATSYYQEIQGSNLPVRTQLEETYIQATHEWGDVFTTIAAFGYNKELDTDTKNFTPILENRFYFDEINTLKLTIEHQQTTVNSTTEKYFDDVITLEYLRSPKFNASIVSEMQTREPDPGRKIRKFWNFIQFGYKIGNHTDISLLFGSRQAGNICIGGVCRYEPEFSGVELRTFTRF